MKLRLNVLMVFSEEASLFSAFTGGAGSFLLCCRDVSMVCTWFLCF